MTRTALPLIALALVALAPERAAAQTSLTPEQVARLKAAATFIKVTAGPLGGTGSGFVVRVDGTAAYVVTNFHVIDLAVIAAGGEKGVKPAIEVVFDSGNTGERTAVGSVVAIDPERDLAVLKVTGVKKLPEPIDLKDPPTVIETTAVYVCGFPFGERIGGVTDKNPEISIGQATVSSMRKDATGRVSKVQLNGALNPGNSGGPVVTADGKLVGVAVSTIRASGLGFAIPQQDVAEMMRGRVGLARVVPPDAPNGPHAMKVLIVDPLKGVTKATAHILPGEDPPREKPTPTAPILAGAKPLPLVMEKFGASAPLPVADGQKVVWAQFELETATGRVVTPPVDVKVSAAAPANRPGTSPSPNGVFLPPPALRLPPPAPGSVDLSDLNRAPEKFLGQAITVDALTSCVLSGRDDGYDLDVSFPGGKSPSGVRFELPKDLAFQLNDLGISPGDTFAVRVSGTVRKPAGRDKSKQVVSVQTVEFVDDDGKPVTTFKPAVDPPTGEPTLETINRFPDRFKGKTLTLTAYCQGIGFAGRSYEVKVVNENEAKPLNLAFYTSKDVATQAEDELPRGTLAVKLTFTVERVTPQGQGVLGVSKLEILNPRNSQTVKTLTGADKITYPNDPPAPKPPTPGLPNQPKATAAPPKPEPEKGTDWLMVGAILGVTLVLLGGAGVGALVILKGKGAPEGKAKYGAKAAEPEEQAPKPRRAKPVRPDPPRDDDFPGFG